MLSHAVSERYLKVVLGLSTVSILLLTLGLHLYEKERFTPKAYPVIKAYKGDVYFYRAEDSALVFYSGRCIKKLEESHKAEGLVITKDKYSKDFERCKALVKGREFDGIYVLFDCQRQSSSYILKPNQAFLFFLYTKSTTLPLTLSSLKTHICVVSSV